MLTGCLGYWHALEKRLNSLGIATIKQSFVQERSENLRILQFCQEFLHLWLQPLLSRNFICADNQFWRAETRLGKLSLCWPLVLTLGRWHLSSAFACHTKISATMCQPSPSGSGAGGLSHLSCQYATLAAQIPSNQGGKIQLIPMPSSLDLTSMGRTHRSTT